MENIIMLILGVLISVVGIESLFTLFVSFCKLRNFA